MTVSQRHFRDALLDAGRPVPDGLQDAAGAPAGARFSVYRNNVVMSLTEALSTAFPLLRKLLGPETFSRLAAHYVRAHPPSSPLMMFYGETLPEFLERFEPLQHIGYLADCAGLDLALRRSYHAADAPPFDAAALQPGDAEAMATKIALAPSAVVLRSNWPLYDIWRFNFEPSAPKPKAVAQDVLISRPEFDPQPHVLPPGAADWLALLDSGMSIGAATEKVLTDNDDFDLTKALTLALTSGAFAPRHKTT